MNTTTSKERGFSRIRRARAAVWMSLATGLAAAGLGSGGCTDAKPKPPTAEVKTVEAYGLTLGPSATPQQVVYALLRSIADDYAAAKSHDHDAQTKAQQLTFSLAAPGVMEQRMVDTANQLNPDLHKQGLGKDRDDKLFKTVHYWAPIVGYYVPSFDKLTVEELSARSWSLVAPDGKTSHVFLPVSHDPSVTDPAQAETATIDVELNREQATSGNDAYWRVSRVRFLGRQFAGPKQAHTVQAYGMNLDGSAAPEQVAAVLLRSLAEMGQAALDGNKDLRASALYRVLALIDPLQVEARSRSGLATADAVAGKTLSGIVNGWADQMQRIVGVGEVKPEQIQPAAGADGKTTVATYADSSGGKATIQLMQAPAGGVTYWRVVDVKLLSGAPAQPSMSATSTRAGG